MKMLRIIDTLERILLALTAGFLVAACGGGGGGGGGGGAGAAGGAPVVAGALVSFPTNGVPPGALPPGYNSFAAIVVQDSASAAPITNASVSVNATALAYVAANQDYEAALSVAPGDRVSLTVSVAGATYTASGTQFSTYPTITSPQSGATWSAQNSNLMAWSGVAPASAQFELLVLDTSGQQVWPAGSGPELVPSTTSSYTIPAASLTVGSRYVLAGVVGELNVANAVSGSGFLISGFTFVPITVSGAPPATLVSIAVTPPTPTLGQGQALQLTATGTYSDGSTQDLTTQVQWSSSDSGSVTVGTSGLAAAVSNGSAKITATLGAIYGAATVTVFQPNPSPVPPLNQAVAYQVDYAHSGRAAFGTPLALAAGPTWSATLNGAISYPLIAGGKVFVLTGAPAQGAANGTSLYALDEATGSILWGPLSIAGSLPWSGHAYDHGQIFVVNTEGLLRSFDAATGQAGWSVQMPGQYSFSSPPTAVNGIVYVGGAGDGGTLYAVDEASGNVLWSALVENGEESSPAVSSDGVFVSYPCQVYKFDPISGASLWHYAGPCEGGGGKTPAFANGQLYVRDPSGGTNQIFDATTGSITGSFAATPIPALSTQTGFFLSAGTLSAINLATQTVVWSFTGDGALVSAPIVIDQVVFVASGNGKVYALDAASGTQLYSGSAGAPIQGPDEFDVGRPLTGLGAGEGYLVVPAGSVLTGWRL